jgi:hypothetical protein
MDWSALAVRLGFADQAHFVHAFNGVDRPATVVLREALH